MSATVTAERTVETERRFRYAISDGWVLTKRNLVTYVRKPDLLVFSTIQPVMFVLLFVYVFGGAMKLALPPGLPYVDFLMPGIFVQTASFTLIFPFVFASSAFVPADTFPSWLQSWSNVNPVSIWVDTFRDLTLGPLNPAGENLITHLWQSTAWFLALLVIFVPLSVRLYRRT